jgi:hypothetical protein
LLLASLGVISVRATSARSPQEDAFLTSFYADTQSVLCADYLTANGARVATYQWWLLGFVSGADRARTVKRPMTRADVDRVLDLAETHCSSHPKDSLWTAAAVVADTLAATHDPQ